MAQYIPKEPLVAEIERRIADNKKDIKRASHKNLEDYFEGYEDGLALLKQQFLDTLEVKEVDLDEHQIADIIQNLFPLDQFIESETLLLDRNEAILFAKHFFELGMQVSNKAQKGEEV